MELGDKCLSNLPNIVKKRQQMTMLRLYAVYGNYRPVYSCIFPSPRQGGIKSKDLEIGKEIKGWKNEKM